jgi:AI-2 transport protein TqsA
MTIHPRPSNRRVQTVCLLILTLIALGVALALLRPVLVPFVLALFFAQCLAPVIDFQICRLRFPRVVAVTVASVMGLALLTGIGFLIAASVGKMSDKSVAYQASVQQFTHDLIKSPPARWLGIKPDTTVGEILNVPEQQTIDFITAVLAETKTVLSQGATVLLLLAFILFGRRQRAPNRAGILAEIEARVQRYINLTVFISFLTGCLVGAVLSILGVQFAALFGFLAFLLNFIPNIGAVIATLLPLPIIFLSPQMTIVAKVLAIAIPAAIQVAIGSLVQPKMLGNSLQLHPVVLLLALLFFTMIWGVPGAFLATPLTAVIKIIFEKIPATHALAAVLAGDLGLLTMQVDEPEPPADPMDLWHAPEPQETRSRQL